MTEFNKEFLPDLGNAEIIDDELVASTACPKIIDCIDYLMRTYNEPVTDIDLNSLSVNGTVVSDTMDEYLKAKYNSSSALKEVLKTPLHYYFHISQELPKKEVKAFELGTFAHMAFLEPELFEKVRVEPKHNLASKDGIVSMIRFYEKLNSCESVQTDDMKMDVLRDYLSCLRTNCEYQLIAEEHQIIVDVLRRHYKHYGGGIIPRLLKGAIHECSFYGKDEATGLPVKVRPDALNIKENIGVDAVISFKTTSAQDLRKFIYDTAKFQYEISEGMYQKVVSDITGRKFNTTIMIMLQTVPPYLPAVFWWDGDDVANGKYKYQFALQTVKDCTERGLFPGYDAQAENGHFGIIELKQPDWAAKELHPIDIEA